MPPDGTTSDERWRKLRAFPRDELVVVVEHDETHGLG